MNDKQLAKLKEMAAVIREDIIEMIFAAGSGHPGGSLSATELLTYLYFYRMNVNPKNPDDPGRDRFILSKGHACPVQYSTLAEKGYFNKDVLWTLRDIDSILQGHPDMNKTPGIDITTGSLGQGFSHGVGMALASRVNKLDYKVYVLLGDGELQEGQIWEAAMAASHYSLGNLVAIVDDNGLQCDGCTDDVMRVRPIGEKFASFGFDVAQISADDMTQMDEAFESFDYTNGRPKCIVMESVKGRGVCFMENEAGWHGGAPNEQEYRDAINEIRGA